MRRSLEDIRSMVREVPYPGQLPDEIRHLHTYIIDSGHCIMAIPECLFEEAKASPHGLAMYEVPLPVRFVLERGYKLVPESDMITVDVEYDPFFGAMTGEGYEEF